MRAVELFDRKLVPYFSKKLKAIQVVRAGITETSRVVFIADHAMFVMMTAEHSELKLTSDVPPWATADVFYNQIPSYGHTGRFSFSPYYIGLLSKVEKWIGYNTTLALRSDGYAMRAEAENPSIRFEAVIMGRRVNK